MDDGVILIARLCLNNDGNTVKIFMSRPLRPLTGGMTAVIRNLTMVKEERANKIAVENSLFCVDDVSFVGIDKILLGIYRLKSQRQTEQKK